MKKKERRRLRREALAAPQPSPPWWRVILTGWRALTPWRKLRPKTKSRGSWLAVGVVPGSVALGAPRGSIGFDGSWPSSLRPRRGCPGRSRGSTGTEGSTTRMPPVAPFSFFFSSSRLILRSRSSPAQSWKSFRKIAGLTVIFLSTARRPPPQPEESLAGPLLNPKANKHQAAAFAAHRSVVAVRRHPRLL